MFNVDGLWVGDMYITIKRQGTPIPDSMQEQPIVRKLTETEAKAVAAILGFGQKDGMLLTYRDEDLTTIITTENDEIKRSFLALSSDSYKSRRNESKIFTPAASIPQAKTAWDNDPTLKEGQFLSLKDTEDIED